MDFIIDVGFFLFVLVGSFLSGFLYGRATKKHKDFRTLDEHMTMLKDKKQPFNYPEYD